VKFTGADVECAAAMFSTYFVEMNNNDKERFERLQ
jgi:hypothetical protein